MAHYTTTGAGFATLLRLLYLGATVGPCLCKSLFRCTLMLLDAYGFTFTDETDRKALLDFKSQVSEDKQDVLSSWNNSFPLCNWRGVTCGLKHKRVTGLDLGGWQLGGVISPSIYWLGGDLPTSITNLSTNLWKLDLGRNFISGTIPYDIGNLISLQKLRLDENLLTGPLPRELPSSLGNITRLEQLYLSSNSFEGAVPPSLGHCKYILYLWIGSNKLNGTIPQEIMQIQSLVYLNLSDNSLTGSLPKYIKPLERLCTLSVEHNKLSGKLPQVLGDCLSVENLYLQGNFFDGDIPNIKGLMGAKRLDFSNNNLFGSIPGYFANFSHLEYLNLSINSFEGEVPTEGKFQNATVVTVFGNKGVEASRN
ncbi:unnamed protein product [Brassica oleracea]|uniref:(rape) hypothetical protein n=1 Tax=Brassica napus TaxID=3708 RepID=A0A816J233_BRANA|nr:unnamed protein product [Brassica napus]